jgi:hypothetical protein
MQTSIKTDMSFSGTAGRVGAFPELRVDMKRSEENRNP